MFYESTQITCKQFDSFPFFWIVSSSNRAIFTQSVNNPSLCSLFQIQFQSPDYPGSITAVRGKTNLPSTEPSWGYFISSFNWPELLIKGSDSQIHSFSKKLGIYELICIILDSKTKTKTKNQLLIQGFCITSTKATS